MLVCRRSLRFLKSLGTTIPSISVKQISFSYSLRFMSRYSGNTIMSDGGIFCVDDYDIIGFDLDNTLACYNLPDMINLEYEVLADYLVQHKNYPKEILKPIGDDIDFLQKGLLLDADRGNLLKIAGDGTILKASHGTRFLCDEDIEKIYGSDRNWDVSSQFVDDPLSTWNGPLSEKMRTFLDYFDMPAALIVARIVDAIDSKNSSSTTYNTWPDILDGLKHLYRREAFAEGTSEYFEEIKAEPERYITKQSTEVINWLKEIKRTKATFLLTGSNIDFSEVVANRTFGPEWKQLFDVVVTYARKPGFFTEHRDFYETFLMQETTKINTKNKQLKLNNVYSQGNWNELRKLLKDKFNKKNPRCLYIGDNLLQDIYTPCKYIDCDTISVVNEMLEDEKLNQQQKNNDNYEFLNVISSNKWGSYFGINNKSTIWTDIILNYSKICIPKIDFLTDKPINYKYNCFNNGINLKGFYPNKPNALSLNNIKC